MQKKHYIGLILVLFTILNVYSQNKNQTIKISDDIELIRVKKNIYIHRSYFKTQNFGYVGANGLVIINNNKALLIDTPWDNKQTEVLYKYLKDSLNTTIDTFVASHWHDDCIGGIKFLESKNVETNASKKTATIAKDKNICSFDKTFKTNWRINSYNTPVECIYLGGGHTTDNLLVWLPEFEILFGGCCIKDLSSKNLGNLEDADIKAWPKTMNKIKKKFATAEIIIPGHGNVGGAELFDYTLLLLKKLEISREV